MESFSPKELKKLAKACRQAGIRSFKGFGIEFVLDEAPEPTKHAKAPPQTTQDLIDEINEDAPTGDALLFWSAPTPQEQEEDSKQS